MAEQRRRHPREDQEPKEFEEVVVNIDRVARVVKGGRRFRFKALVVVGDGKKRVGIGVSKGADVQAAVTKATDKAKKSLVTISTFQSTIPHDTFAKVGGAKVLLKQAAPGTGIIAGGTVRSILNVTGINNVLSKSLGSSNKVNVAYATIEALKQLTPKNQWVTEVGGEKSKEQKADKKVAKATKVETEAAPEEEKKAAKTPAKQKAVKKAAPKAKKETK